MKLIRWMPSTARETKNPIRHRARKRPRLRRLPERDIGAKTAPNEKARMKTPLSLESRNRCEARLGELSQADMTNLTEFAEHRFVAQGVNPVNPLAAEHVTQRALAAIL